MPEIKYQRLTRTRTRAFFSVAAATRTSLWLGPDHLLCVDFNGYSESYKRFYFRDIQSIILWQTSRRSIWNIVLGVLLAILFICMVLSYQSTKEVGVIIGWSIAELVVLIPFVLNNILGTACIGQLRTAVQTEDLPSLSRIPRARKVLDRIRPLIAAAQGEDLAPEQIASRMRELQAVPPTLSSPAPTVDHPDAPPRLEP